jgi:hypothetical protein
MCWATFWAIFSQTHPVTLFGNQTFDEEKRLCSNLYRQLVGEMSGWLLALDENVFRFTQ